MMNEFHFENSLQKLNFFFKYTGLNIDCKKRCWTQSFVLIFNFLWHQTDVIACALWVIFGMIRGENFTDLTPVVPCVILGILADIKTMFIFFKEGRVWNLINNLKETEIKANAFVNFEIYDLSKPEIDRLNRIIKVLNILSCSMFVVFIILPLLYIAVKYLTTGQLELLLPYLAVYPFDSFDLRYWPFAYFHQIWSACIALLEICATDYFFYTCCTHIRIQFKLLQYQFKEIIFKNSGSAVDSIDQGSVYAKLQELVKWHQKIISSANMLGGIYSESTLFNFIVSSMMICVTGFNVTMVEDKVVVVTFITFLSMNMVQIFFLCLFGDILMRSSTEVAEAVYQSKWYHGDLKTRRFILMVLIRAQNPCKLSAAGFADVNLSSYMKILSTSWSYFTLLQTMYGSAPK